MFPLLLLFVFDCFVLSSSWLGDVALICFAIFKLVDMLKSLRRSSELLKLKADECPLIPSLA